MVRKKKPGMLRKMFMAAALGGLAFGASVEWTGYNLFNRPDGSNPLCEIDSTCRRMTDDEIKVARNVFGDKIDYSKIKIFMRPYYGVISPDSSTAMSPNGHIYIFSKDVDRKDLSHTDVSRQLLVHELTHVMQHQRGIKMQWSAALLNIRYKFHYSKAYDYRLEGSAKFSSLNIEQQAEMIEDYSALRELIAATPVQRFNREYRRDQCRELAAYRARLDSVLPPPAEQPCKDPIPEGEDPPPFEMTDSDLGQTDETVQDGAEILDMTLPPQDYDAADRCRDMPKKPPCIGVTPPPAPAPGV